MRVRTIEILGFKIDIYRFKYKSFYYPQFNGDAEFEVSAKGFRELHGYLRNVIWGNNMVKKCEKLIFES